MDSVNWLHVAVHKERFYNWLRKTSWWYVLREVLLAPLTTQQCKDHQFFNHARPSLLDRWLVIHSLLWRNRHACVTSQLPLVLICRHKFPMPPTAGQEPGAETSGSRGRALLIGWLVMAHSAYSQSNHDHQRWGSIALCELECPLTNHQSRKMHRGLCTGQSSGSVFSAEVPIPKTTASLYHVGIKLVNKTGKYSWFR